MQVPKQHFLVAVEELVDRARLDHRLGGLQGVGVLQSVFLERHRGQLLRDTFPGGTRRREVDVALEDVGVVRRRPVVIGQIPALPPEQDDEVGEQLKRIQTPRTAFGGVEADRHLAEVGTVPWPEKPALADVFDRFAHRGIHLPRPDTRGAHQAVRPVDLVVRCLEPSLCRGLGERRRRLVRMQNRVRDRTPGTRPCRASSSP